VHHHLVLCLVASQSHHACPQNLLVQLLHVYKLREQLVLLKHRLGLYSVQTEPGWRIYFEKRICILAQRVFSAEHLAFVNEHYFL